MKKLIIITLMVVIAATGVSLLAQQVRQIGQPQSEGELKRKIDYPAEYERLTAENQKLNQEIAALRTTISNLTKESAELKAVNAKQNAEIVELRKQAAAALASAKMKEELDLLSKRNAELQRENEKLKAEIESLRKPQVKQLQKSN